MERVALYARVSTEEQTRHGLSLAEQEHSLTEYARDHKMKVVDTYIDAGISARKRYTKRPELLRLLEDVKAGRIDTILFIKLDRWFRSVEQYYEVQQILDQYHVTWRATQEDYETVTASGRFKVNIMLSVAQDEADRTSERIKFVFDGKRERGEPITGNVPTGYKLVNKKVAIDPETAPLIEKVFDTFLETASIGKSAAAVPELNLSHGSCAYILGNKSYTGTFGGVSIPPIIDAGKFCEVQELRKRTIRTPKHNYTYLFSGMLYCPECGRRLVGNNHISRRKDRIFFYYVCDAARRRHECTHGAGFREDKIEDYLIEHIDSKIKAVIPSERNKKSNKPKRLAVNKKITRLSDLYINGMIDMDDYKKRRADLDAQLAAIPPDEPEVNVRNIRETFVPNWKDLYYDLAKEDKARFWRKTIREITLDDKNVSDFLLR